MKFSCDTVRPLKKYEVKEIDGKTSLRFSFLHISRSLKRTPIAAAAQRSAVAVSDAALAPLSFSFSAFVPFLLSVALFATRIALHAAAAEEKAASSVRPSVRPSLQLLVVRDATALFLLPYPGK